MNPLLKARLLSFETWLRGLFAAFLSGAATAFLSNLGVGGANLAGFTMPSLTLKQMGVIALVGGLVGLAAYLKQSPIPSEPPSPLAKTLMSVFFAFLLLPACMVLVGCGDKPAVEVAPPSSGTVVQDKSEAFWAAMKGDLSKAHDFLASPAAKANAPVFARAVWRLSLAGARAAEVDLVPVAQVGVPVCDVVISLTGSASAITSAQIDAVLAGTGNHDSLAAYNPFLALAGPVLDWITDACGEDAALAKFYLGLVAREGKAALTPYLPGAQLRRGERYVEEWADRPRLLLA